MVVSNPILSGSFQDILIVYTQYCDILTLLSIVTFPMQIIISLRDNSLQFLLAHLYKFKCYGFVLLKIAGKSVRRNCASCTYPGSVQFLLYHSGGISVSRVCYGFLYYLPSFLHLLSLYMYSFSICLSLFLVKLVFVYTNKVVRCLKFSVSLVSTRIILWRSDDNTCNLTN